MALVAVLLAACGSEDSGGSSNTGGSGDGGGGSAQSVEVTATDFKFDPTSLDVDPGAEVSVTLTNDGETAHTFTVDDVDFEIQAEPGKTAEGTFTAPDSGSLEFHCSFHSQMTGTISVGGSTGGGGGSGNDDQSPADMGGY
jgi:cytochrome c oxidase subunit 2